MSLDGGVVALSGFLYQAWVLGGLLAKSKILEDDDTHLEALVSLAKVSDLHFERFDQDIVLCPRAEVFDHGIVLVQLKYSIHGMDDAIAAYDMRTEVINAFKRAKVAATTAGETIAGYWLITNRHVTGVPQDGWTIEEREIFDLMFQTDDAQIQKWKTALVTYAREFGCKDDDITRGRNELFGGILTNSQNPVPTFGITDDELVRCMGRDSSARPVVRRLLRTRIRQELAHFDADIPRIPVRREEMNRAMAEGANRALIVFQGDGGYGKTASLYQWAKALNDDETAEGPLVSLNYSGILPEDWIKRIFRGWNPGYNPIDEPDALSRLKIANPANQAPILHLGLDGVDDEIESGSIKINIKNLVEYFADLDVTAQSTGEPPPARLVITCRDYDKFRRNRLAGSLSGGRTRTLNNPLLFNFRGFTDEELRRLVHDNFLGLQADIFGDRPGEFAAPQPIRIVSSGSLTFNDAWSPSAFTDDPWNRVPSALGPPVVRNVRRNYAGFLKDPVIWRAFCEMEDHQRLQWLGGDDNLDAVLGGIYVERFAQKASARTSFEPDEIIDALRRVAAGTNPEPPRFYTVEEWLAPCTLQSAMRPDEARKLKHEARSGGVILEESPTQWEWRNSFITSYLIGGGLHP